jgi:DNA-binding response OmpR family regulator
MSKILVVEDDKAIALALSVRLKAHGHEVSVSYDAMGGLIQARQNKPDLVLLDIGMPAGGGFGLAEKMQNLPGVAGTPFIFLTASSKPEYRTRAMELGAAAYFSKPFDSKALLDAIENTLSRTHRAVAS